jgi:TrfA protein
MEKQRGINEQLESFRLAIKADERSIPPPPESPRKPSVQLQIWPEPIRASPNSFLRSALFAAIQSENRRMLGEPATPHRKAQGVSITTQKGLTIEYAGPQLDQFDLDVWLQAIHLVRRYPLETRCSFTGNAFLKAMGRRNGNHEYEDLNQSLDRLVGGGVVIKSGPITFTGHLISWYRRDDHTRAYQISFADDVLKLFRPATWTAIQWEERRALKGKNLVLWLHGYYSSHAAPYPVSVQYLHVLCGSRSQRLKSFKSELKKAFAILLQILGWQTIWDGDLVTVTRPPSASQARHVLTSATTKKRNSPPKRGQGGLVPVTNVIPDFLKSLKT